MPANHCSIREDQTSQFFSFCVLKTRHKWGRRRSSGTRGSSSRAATRGTSARRRRTVTKGTSGRRRRTITSRSNPCCFIPSVIIFILGLDRLITTLKIKEKKYIINYLSGKDTLGRQKLITLYLPLVTKREFLPTVSIQYQA